MVHILTEDEFQDLQRVKLLVRRMTGGGIQASGFNISLPSIVPNQGPVQTHGAGAGMIRCDVTTTGSGTSPDAFDYTLWQEGYSGVAGHQIGAGPYKPIINEGVIPGNRTPGTKGICSKLHDGTYELWQVNEPMAWGTCTSP
jgi:hypothetical protein